MVLLEDENGSKDECGTIGFTSSSFNSFRIMRSAFTHSGRNCMNEGSSEQKPKGYQETLCISNLLYHKSNHSSNDLNQTWIPPFVSSVLLFILITLYIPQGSTVFSSGTGFSIMSLQSSKLWKTFSNSSLKPYLRYELVEAATVRNSDSSYVLLTLTDPSTSLLWVLIFPRKQHLHPPLGSTDYCLFNIHILPSRKCRQWFWFLKNS